MTAAFRRIAGLCLLLAAGCESSLPSSDDGTTPNPPSLPSSGATFLVVGNPGGLNASERAVRDRLRSTGHEVTILDDDGVTIPGSCRLVVLSKTSKSEAVGSRLKSVGCGVLFWEDNQQMLGMMATIDNDGSQGTGWHSTRTTVDVQESAPAALRASRSGTIGFYSSSNEITWAPEGDLPGSATVVALLGDPAKGRAAIYVFDEGATLADGSRAAGRRVFFGLYDDTFVLLTSDGLALFDALASWAGQ